MKVTYTAPNFAHHVAYAQAMQDAEILKTYICGASRFSPRHFPERLNCLTLRRDYIQNFFLASLRWGRGVGSASLRIGSKLFLDWSSRKYAVDSDVFLFYPGCGLHTMNHIKSMGHKVQCVIDYPTTHVEFRQRLLDQESKLLGIPKQTEDRLDYARILEEIQLADAIICPSEFALNSFREMNVPDRKLHLVGYSAESRLEKRRGAVCDDSVFNVLYVGQINYRKGIKYLIEAVDNMSSPCPKRLTLVGPEAHPTGLSSLELSKKWIKKLGALAGEQLAAQFAWADVLVLPSIEDSFGLVVAEAMGAGLPVIVSENAGAADLIRSGKGGFIVPARGVTEMTACLELLSNDPQFKIKTAADAYDAFKSNSSWDKVGQRLVDVLARIHQNE